MKARVVKSYLKYSTIGFLAVLGLVAIFVGGISTKTINTTKQSLVDQGTTQMASIVVDGSQVIELTLVKLIGLVQLMALQASFTTRSDYPFKGLLGYMDTQVQPASGQFTFNSKYNANVSMIQSTYNVPQATPATIGSFSGSLNQSIQRSMANTIVARQLLLSGSTGSSDQQQSQPFISIYHAEATTGLFVEFPGITVSNPSSIASYDARNEAWYQRAINLQQSSSSSSSIVSDVYFDPYVQARMITISKLYNIIGNTNVSSANNVKGGVAAGDITVQDTKTIVKSLRYLSARALMLEQSGNVVADSLQDEQDSATTTTYSDVGISDEVWAQIIDLPIPQDTGGSSSTSQGRVLSVEDNDKYIVMTRFTSPELQSFFVGFVIDKSAVLSSLDQVLTKIQNQAKAISGSLAAVFVASLCIIIGLSFWLTTRVVSGLHTIIHEAQDLPKYMGTSVALPMPTNSNLWIDECNELQSSLTAVLKQFNASRAEINTSGTGNLPANKFFNMEKGLPWLLGQPLVQPSQDVNQSIHFNSLRQDYKDHSKDDHKDYKDQGNGDQSRVYHLAPPIITVPAIPATPVFQQPLILVPVSSLAPIGHISHVNNGNDGNDSKAIAIEMMPSAPPPPPYDS